MNLLCNAEVTLEQRCNFDVVLLTLWIQYSHLPHMLRQCWSSVSNLTLWHQRHCNVVHWLYKLRLYNNFVTGLFVKRKRNKKAWFGTVLFPFETFLNLEDFSIIYNECYWTGINTFEATSFFVKISTHSNYDVAMPLHQTCCFTCVCSFTKFLHNL